MLNRDSVVLLVIDLQDRLLEKVPVAESVCGRTVDMVRFARELDVPILWTEQYSKGLGATRAAIAEVLADCSPIEKMAFGCFGDDGFLEAFERLGRTQLLVTGIETHVCVMQTSLQGLERGLEVYVVRDAVASRAKAEYKAGLARMDRAGATLVTTEMAMFELLRVAGTAEFKRVLPLLK